MQITSFLFFFSFALLFVILYGVDRLVKDPQKSTAVSNWILLIASYGFVFYADWRFAAALAAITVSTWFFAGRKKGWGIGIVIAVASLAFFKYTNFFASSFASILGHDHTALNIILPLGISFYSFSAIGYIVDIRRETIKPKGLKEVALYLSFFPKITSGPIQESKDFFEQAERRRSIGWCSFEPGIQIFVWGLFKKIVFADRLNVFVDQVYAAPKAFGSFTVFLAAIAYSLQIYFDFSGYSDMAIGVARMLGFELPRNFNLPYLSHNVTEFWKRWHITLSAWLQKYIYISLGGNRRGTVRTYLNLIITMVLGGIWHGANWTFILWGLLHGLALAVHKVWMSVTKSDRKKPTVFGSVVSVTVTFLFTTFCWIFFRADSVSQAFTIIQRIFSFERGLEQPYLWLFIPLIILAIFSFTAFRKSKRSAVPPKKLNVSTVECFYPLVDLSTLWGLVWFFVFCGAILCFAYTEGGAFIYGAF